MKDSSTEFSIESLKAVTKQLNNKRVKIPDMIFTYRSYYCMPRLLDNYEQEEEFGTIIKAFATLHKNGLRFLLEGKYERYLAYIMEEEFHELSTPDTKIYDKYFKIVKYTKIAHKIYGKDTLYVYDDDTILVICEPGLAAKVKKIRNN